MPAMMIGPKSSGRSAARIITAQPAWQLPMTQGLPSASGWRAMTVSRKTASARGDVEDGLAGHRVGQEADEVGRMPGLHRDADLAVGLEAADARAVAGARVDDDERPLPGVDLHPLGRDDAGEQVVDRAGEGAAVEDELGLVVEDVRRELARRAPRTGRRAGASRRERGSSVARRRSGIPR